jgi:hypothetical protein
MVGGGKRCDTCFGYGHDFLQCENECVTCRKHHNGGVCPVAPEYYPKANADDRARSLESMQERIDHERQRLEDLNKELAVAKHLEIQIDALRKKVEARSGGPIPQLPAGKNAALMAMGKKDGKDATWRDIHPDWKGEAVSTQQTPLKTQWNAEALDHQPFAQDSMLMAALIQRGRWPVQRDGNGFPIE